MLRLLPPLLIAAAVGMNVALEERALDLRVAARDSVYLPPSWLARLASVDHPTLAADYFWLQALQYYGERTNKRVQYKDLYRYIELITDLDPDFHYAYTFGSVSVPYNTGRWTWHNTPQAEGIIHRGLQRFPNDWKLHLQLGFIRGVLGDDRESAARAYARAAKIPGSPAYLPQLVARLYSDAGRLDRAALYTQAILSDPDLDPATRESMERRLVEIEIEKDLVRLDRLVARFEEAHGRLPEDMDDLVREGLLHAPPTDPLGGGYRIRRGEAYSSSLHGGRLHVFTGDE